MEMTDNPSTSITIESVEPIVQNHNSQANGPIIEKPTDNERTPKEATKMTRRMQAKKSIEDSLQDRGVIRLKVENLNGIESLEVSPFAIKLELNRKQMRRNALNKRRTAMLYYLARYHHKFGIRHIVLVLLLALYSVLGGVMFMRLESPLEVHQLYENQKALTNSIFNLTVAIFEIANATLTPEAEELSSIIIRAYYRDMLETEGKFLGSVFHKFERIDTRLTWTYSTAIFYSMTLFTTIGYGTIACQTVIGKTLTVIYATIGLPLMLVVLSDVGRLLLKWLTAGYNTLLKLFWKIRHSIAKHLRLFHRYANRDPSLEQQIKEEDFPLELALGISVGYLMFCAVIVEFFDYHDGQTPNLSFGDSFYFAFVSMSTIGLGDVMPNSIEYSPILALMFLFGLSLVGVVNTTVYSKMENRFLNGVDNVEGFFEGLYVHRHGKEGYEMMRKLGPCIQLLVIALPLFDDNAQVDKALNDYLDPPSFDRRNNESNPASAKPRRRIPISLGIFGAFGPRRQRSYTLAACDAEGHLRPDAEHGYMESSTRPITAIRRVWSDREKDRPPSSPATGNDAVIFPSLDKSRMKKRGSH